LTVNATPASPSPTPWPRPADPRRRPPEETSLIDRLIMQWRLIAIVAGAGAVIGGIGSFLLPQTFTSSAVFVPEKSKGAALPSGLGALAGQFGILAGSEGTDSPEFYQRLLVGRAVGTSILSAAPNGVNLFDYFGVSGKKDSIDRAIKKLAKVTSVSIDKSTGTVRIDVEVKQPALAMAMVVKYLDLVNDYNTNIRRTQAGKKRQFVETQTAVAQTELQAAETAMKDFLVANRIITSPTLQYERGRLERRVNTAQEIYQALSRELQTARIDQVNNTPVISVIDPPYLPVQHSGPRRVVIALIAMFVAGLMVCGYVLLGPMVLTAKADG
jgi:uncharacterized protein involved in exopolysaccharide biosynthesis